MSALGALLSDWVITALWPIIAKYGVERFSAALFAQIGVALGFLSLSPWLILKGRWKRVLSPKLRGPFFMMGLFGSALASFLFITALQYTTPANAAIMAQVEVLYSALLCAWWLGEHISLAQGLGSLLIVMGTGLIMAQDLSTPRWKGDLIILLTPWMFQVSHIYAKRLPKDLDSITIAGGRALYGSLALLPLTLISLRKGFLWSADAPSLGILAVQGIILNCINLVLWYSAIRRMDLSKATAIMLSYPALTLIFSWAMGHETIGIAQLAGLALSMSGAYWISMLVVKAKRSERSVAGI